MGKNVYELQGSQVDTYFQLLVQISIKSGKHLKLGSVEINGCIPLLSNTALSKLISIVFIVKIVI